MLNIDEERLKFIFSTNLKKIMSLQGLGDNDVSDQTEISRSAIQRMRNGLVCPSLHQVIKIASFFKVSLEYFLQEPADQELSVKEYAPVLNAHSFLNGEKEIRGFCSIEETKDVIGFKYDESFACNLLKKDAVVLVRKVYPEEKFAEGDPFLFLENDNYKVGIYTKGSLRPLDNFTKTFPLHQVTLVGRVVQIETQYIKEKSLVEQIISSWGTKKLNTFIDNQLPLLA